LLEEFFKIGLGGFPKSTLQRGRRRVSTNSTARTRQSRRNGGRILDMGSLRSSITSRNVRRRRHGPRGL
jgi:hypothetical protein